MPSLTTCLKTTYDMLHLTLCAMQLVLAVSSFCPVGHVVCLYVYSDP